MSALFISFIVVAVIGLIIALGVAQFLPKQDKYNSDVHPRKYARLGGTGVLVVSLIILLFSSITTVGTKQLAVQTTFGRPSGSYDNGIHFKTPWSNTTELNAAVQTDTYASDGGSGGKQQGGAVGTCINVRIARQATSCVNVSIRYQIKQQGVDYLFQNYRNVADDGIDKAIEDNLILRDLQIAVNDAFVNYDPLGIDANGKSTNPVLSGADDSLSNVVLKSMQDQLGQWIDVSAVNIPIQNFDGATQDKINQLQQQIAQTRVAVQAQQTATAQAAANKALAASVADDPNVLVSKCLDILKDAVDKGQALPAGFSCFGPSGSSVAVTAGK